MEQNLSIIAKKFWNIVRVLYFMQRKGISKAKLLADLSSMMMKRAMIAGKAAIHNLMFHHATVRRSHAADRNISFMNEYEFSCSNSPAFQCPSFHLNKKKHAAAPPPIDGELLAAALEMINSGGVARVRAEPHGQTAEDNGFTIPIEEK